MLYRLYLYLKNKFDPPKKVPEEELICHEICRKLAKLQDSQLTIAPLSHKRYIKNDRNNMFIVIESRVIMIVNHIYSYTVYCENDELYLETISIFDNAVEEKRVDLEKQIQSNIQHSLKNILETLNRFF